MKSENKPQENIKERLNEFLQEDGAKTIMNNCVLPDGASWLNSQIKITVTKSDKNKIVIEIKSNADEGFTEFKKEYDLDEPKSKK